MTRSKYTFLIVANLLWLAGLPDIAHAAEAATLTVRQSVDTFAQPPTIDPVAALAAYEQRIAELQTRQPGPDVNVELGELYVGLGNSLQVLERHIDAIDAFDNALQIIRERKGLYELEQLPVLQAQLDSHEALSAWQQVDAGKHLAYLITLKSPTASTEHRYQALRELGLWKLRAAEDELLPDALVGASDAAALYRHELERPEVRSAYASLSVANLNLDLAALEFLQARKKLELPLSAYVTGGQRTIPQTYCETIQTGDGRGRQVCRSMQVPNMDYFMSLSDRKYREVGRHLDATEDAVLEAYTVLLGEVDTQNRADALGLLSEVHRLTDAHNDFTAANGRKSGSRIAPPTGSRIR